MSFQELYERNLEIPEAWWTEDEALIVSQAKRVAKFDNKRGSIVWSDYDVPPRRSIDDEGLHRFFSHPDYEYLETTCPRKGELGWSPIDKGWEPNFIFAWEDSTGEMYYRNWERDEYVDTDYWKRRKQMEIPAIDIIDTPWPGYCQSCFAPLDPPNSTTCHTCYASDADE